jgi:predicted secreted protein
MIEKKTSFFKDFDRPGGRDMGRLLIIAILLFFAPCLMAGDIASFVDLGFSPDGKTYMFGQYGVQSGTLKPWADLFVVDVAQNDFVSGGKFSYTHNTPVTGGQDGAGALYRLIAQTAETARRYGISFLLQGYPLYVSTGNRPGTSSETVEFRDFGQDRSYRAVLVTRSEGTGAALRSSFYITLERTNRNGTKNTYTAGSPEISRAQISSYGIKKIMTAPQNGSMVFVIEMRKSNNDTFDVRYMVEVLQL